MKTGLNINSSLLALSDLLLCLWPYLKLKRLTPRDSLDAAQEGNADIVIASSPPPPSLLE